MSGHRVTILSLLHTRKPHNKLFFITIVWRHKQTFADDQTQTNHGENTMSKTIHIYIDGACKGNPGPGGWGVLIQQIGQPDIELYGGKEHTTNNRMELEAAIQAMTRVLPLVEKGAIARVYTDSKYVRDGLTQWLPNWKQNGWRTTAGKQVKNSDLWVHLDILMHWANLGDSQRVTWEWIKGHSGHSGNDRADFLANQGVAAEYY